MSVIDRSLTGASVIVTGAATGIGGAVAERLARAGASICVNNHGLAERGIVQFTYLSHCNC